MSKESTIRDFDDFKNLIMNELTELVVHNPLYVRLESMRTAVFEKNVDAETMLNQKLNLYKLMTDLVTIICENNALTQEDVIDILQAETSIITGCKLSATLPAEVIDIIEKYGLDGLKRDFKNDVLATMNHYLDGYIRNRR